MSDEGQSGTATIARLACTYALPRASAAAQPLRWRLDQVLEGRLEAALGRALASLDGVDPESVWIVRRLRADVIVSANLDDLDLLARQWSRQLADAILAVLRGGPGGNVVRFSNRAAYLAAFAAALASRRAESWPFEPLAGLRRLSPSAAIRTGADGAGVSVTSVVAELAAARRLDAVVAASTAIEVAALWAACLAELGAARAASHEIERVRVLEAQSADSAALVAPTSERALRLLGGAARRFGATPSIVAAVAAVIAGGGAPTVERTRTRARELEPADLPDTVVRGDHATADDAPAVRERDDGGVDARVFAAHGAHAFLLLPSLERTGLDAVPAVDRARVLSRILGLPADAAIDLAAGVPAGESVGPTALLRQVQTALALDDRIDGRWLVTEVVRLPGRRVAIVRDAASDLWLAGLVRPGGGRLPWRSLVERASAASGREPEGVFGASTGLSLPADVEPLRAADTDIEWLDPRDDGELAVCLAAHAVLRDLARRLLGFGRSSMPYLVERFLPPGGVVAVSGRRIHAELPVPQLSVILTMAGLDTIEYRVPWLEQDVLVTHREPS